MRMARRCTCRVSSRSGGNTWNCWPEVVDCSPHAIQMPSARLRGECGGYVGTGMHPLCQGSSWSRPPTAEEKRSRRRGAEQPTDYFTGIYAVGQSEARMRAYRTW